MIPKKYTIYTIDNGRFIDMCRSLLIKLESNETVLKIVFFGLPGSNNEYLIQLNILNNCVGDYFPDKTPVVCYVAQKPLVGSLNAEVTSITTFSDLKISYCGNYILLEDKECRELITGGILPVDLTDRISVQADSVFSIIEKIFVKEGFPLNSIVRQWNYIENITSTKNESQHYQDFNDSRSLFYAKTVWTEGYPAATGIGTQFGGIMVELIAISGPNVWNKALDNPFQIAAHRYSKYVLAVDCPDKVPSTPKFERARIIGINNVMTIFISGTAAIRGEESWPADNVTEQARITMENIDILISSENLHLKLYSQKYKLLRIYIKNFHQMEELDLYISSHYPDIQKIYICADVCREELLLEIEGISEVIINV